ncbi:MAG: hypothetical protein OXR84_11570 [Magnetovibrio sp.]|nr:hypothetical protein [Magnetovibrio sp.]
MDGEATLEQVISNGYRLRAYCEGCGHTAFLDVIDLAGRYGPARPLSAIRRRLSCRHCRGRACALQIAIDW